MAIQTSPISQAPADDKSLFYRDNCYLLIVFLVLPHNESSHRPEK